MQNNEQISRFFGRIEKVLGHVEGSRSFRSGRGNYAGFRENCERLTTGKALVEPGNEQSS
jgi:hypothetical protein